MAKTSTEHIVLGIAAAVALYAVVFARPKRTGDGPVPDGFALTVPPPDDVQREADAINAQRAQGVETVDLRRRRSF